MKINKFKLIVVLLLIVNLLLVGVVWANSYRPIKHVTILEGEGNNIINVGMTKNIDFLFGKCLVHSWSIAKDFSDGSVSIDGFTWASYSSDCN